MDSVTNLYNALIKGGVTDGKRSVFYSDVLSVELRKGYKLKSVGLRVLGWIFIFGGILITIWGFTEGDFLKIASGIAGVVFFAWGNHGTFGLRKSIVIVTTIKGKKKLVYPQMEAHHRDMGALHRELGQEVAEILNQRKGSGGGTLPTDIFHFLFSYEGEEIQLFRIDGDVLSLLKSKGVLAFVACTIDLRKVARIEKRSRSYRAPKAGGQLSQSERGVVEDDVIFVEHSGQESLHFIQHFFDPLHMEYPAQDLVDAVNQYLTAKVG